MKTRKVLNWLPLVVLAASAAQAESLVDGSIEAGKSKSVTCSACHGTEGVSANPLWPNIAGQGATYLVTQLQAFRDGAANPAEAKRYNALMSPQSISLTDEDIRDLAVYYESLPAPVQAVANPETVDRGEALYRGGDLENGIAACLACHGPAGRGNPAAGYPALQGQHAVYTAQTLRDYASGARKSDGTTRIMRDIAARLSQEDIDALASYIQGLR